MKYQTPSEIETHWDQSYTNWFLSGKTLVRGPFTCRNTQIIREFEYDHVDSTIKMV